MKKFTIIGILITLALEGVAYLFKTELQDIFGELYIVVYVFIGLIGLVISLAPSTTGSGRNDNDDDNSGGVSFMTDGHLGINLGGISIDVVDHTIGQNFGNGISNNSFPS
ncbi:MAG: hypothetical protein WCG55_03000 [bacterium]